MGWRATDTWEVDATKDGETAADVPQNRHQ